MTRPFDAHHDALLARHLAHYDEMDDARKRQEQRDRDRRHASEERRADLATHREHIARLRALPVGSVVVLHRRRAGAPEGTPINAYVKHAWGLWLWCPARSRFAGYGIAEPVDPHSDIDPPEANGSSCLNHLQLSRRLHRLVSIHTPKTKDD